MNPTRRRKTDWRRRESDITQFPDNDICAKLFRDHLGKTGHGDGQEALIPGILELEDFLGKRQKIFVNANEKELGEFLEWLKKRGRSAAFLRERAALVIDFYSVLLQSGVILKNPLIDVYALLIREMTPQQEALASFSSSLAILAGRLARMFQLQSSSQSFPQPKPASPSRHSEPDINPELIVDSEHAIAPMAQSRVAYNLDVFLDRTSRFIDRYARFLIGVAALLLVVSLVRFVYLNRVLLDWWWSSNWEKTTASFHEWNAPETTTPEAAVAGGGQAGTNKPLPKPVETAVERQRQTMKKRKNWFIEKGLSSYYCQNYLNIPCENQPIKINPIIFEFDSVASGRVLYASYCFGCHDIQGHGFGPDAKRLEHIPGRMDLSGDGLLHKDAFLFWTISEGGLPLGTEMPAFKKLLTEDQIWKIISYMETL